jgi:cobalamin synthase
MESNEVDRADAATQLAALRASREALADRVMQPWWFSALSGAMLFALLASYAVDSHWVSLVALVLFLAGLYWMASTYRRLTGVWVSPGSSLHVWGTWVPLVLLVLVPAFALEEALVQRWPMVVAGAVLGVSIALLGRWWSRLYIAELRGER